MQALNRVQYLSQLETLRNSFPEPHRSKLQLQSQKPIIVGDQITWGLPDSGRYGLGIDRQEKNRI